MYVSAPVYYEQNTVHFINIYEETEDGTFRRTQEEPLRLLRDNIKGVSNIQGELLTKVSDRTERSWSSATVTFHYGRPQSFYKFLREMVAKNRFYVFSKPQLSGRMSKFNLHELQLKNGTSQRHLSLLKEKYIAALDLWTQQEWERKQEEKQVQENAANLNASLDIDFGQARAAAADSEFIDIQSLGSSSTLDDDVSFDIQKPDAGAQPTQAQSNSVKRLGEVTGISPNEEANRQFPNRKKDRRSHFLQRFIFTID